MTTIQTQTHFDDICDIKNYLNEQRYKLSDKVQITTCIGEYVFRRINGDWERVG